MKHLGLIVLLIIIGNFFIHQIAFSKSSAERPNIILILIDDLGYGDIGPYNQTIDFTPNIDRLADEGMRFTDFHSNGPMCSPTRAAILTGMYQHRLGERFEAALNSNRGDKGIPLEIVTIAELLKNEGYTTGKFGKWHLGFEEPYRPNNYGFLEFRGLLSGDGDHYTQINRWGKKDWWYNEELNMEDGYTTDLITKHSVNFIEKHKDEPFFLYVSHLSIHFPWQGTDDPPQRKEGENYEDDKWGIIPDEKNVRSHVISMIKSIDNSIGEIIDKLKKLNLERDTLVIFTSDNGGYTHYYQGQQKFEQISDNGLLRGQKTDVYEGGHRVPTIAWWPDKIEPGSVSDETLMTFDLFSTFAQVASINLSDVSYDGVNIIPLLFKEKENIPERTLFWKIRNQGAVRSGPWKLVIDGENFSLYHLTNDIGESVDLSLKHPNIVEELFGKYEDWKHEMSKDAEKWN